MLFQTPCLLLDNSHMATERDRIKMLNVVAAHQSKPPQSQLKQNSRTNVPLT